MPAHTRRDNSRQVVLRDGIKPLSQSGFVLYILSYNLGHLAYILYLSLILWKSSLAHIQYLADIQGITGTEIAVIWGSSG